MRESNGALVWGHGVGGGVSLGAENCCHCIENSNSESSCCGKTISVYNFQRKNFKQCVARGVCVCGGGVQKGD